MQKFDKFDALNSVNASLEETTMATIFFRLLKATAQGALVAVALLPMSAGASPVTFDFDFFGCTADMGPCSGPITTVGGGTITFPELGPASPAAPFLGVVLDLTIESYSFKETDITSISWTISPDMSTLTSLALSLDTDPSWTSPNPGVHDYANVNFSQDTGGTWSAGSEGCTDAGSCFVSVQNILNRTATASPAAVPLPPAFTLFSIGLAGLGFAGRRKKV